MKIQLLAGLLIPQLLGTATAASLIHYSATASPSASPDSGVVDVWTTFKSSTESGQNGFFQGDSAGNGGTAGAGSSAWAMYANSGNEAFASHTYAGGALSLGQTTSIEFDNGFIDAGKSTGIQLFSGATLIFQFYFRGDEANYEFYDAGGFDQDTTENFSLDGGIFSFSLTGDTSYTASYRSASWSGSIASVSTNPIDRLQVYNNSAGSGAARNVYFNNLSVVPEPINALSGGILAAGILRRRRFRS